MRLVLRAQKSIEGEKKMKRKETNLCKCELGVCLECVCVLGVCLECVCVLGVCL